MNQSRNAASDGRLEDRISDLERLVAQLIQSGSAREDDIDLHEQPQFCGLPYVEERKFAANVSSEREELIRYSDKKWLNGTNLKYYLFDTPPLKGSRSNVEMVDEAFKIWTDVGIGITFEKVNDISEAEIRIGFLRGGGSWSYVGRENLTIPKQFERTMNIGWELKHDPGGVDTAVHEIGHAIGFSHAHQNPFSGIVWDEEAVYKYFAGPPNGWDKDRTFHNVLRKLKKSDVEGSAWDPDSIMHYGFPAGLILQPAKYASGLKPKLGLSQTDKNEVKKFYPPIGTGYDGTLRPFQSQVLDIGATQQRNFVFSPDETRDYTFRVFGDADLLMVLFHQQGDRSKYITGSDDSGIEENASITARMVAGEEYVVRVRMFANLGSSNAAIMVW